MDLDVDIGKELGATGEPAAQRLTLYIPNKDRLGQVIVDHGKWVKDVKSCSRELARERRPSRP